MLTKTMLRPGPLGGMVGGRRGAAYPGSALTFGAGLNPAAPLYARNDCDPDDVTSAGGVSNMFPRIPMLAMTKAGTVLSCCEAHEANDDEGISHFLLRRSTDKGRTFGACKAIGRIPAYVTNAKWGNAGVLAANRATGRIHFFYTLSTGAAGVATNNAAIDAMHTYSDDDGVAWSAPVDRSADFKGAPQGWWIAGPGHAVQIRNGANAGRIVVPIVYRTTNDISGTSYSQVMYSDDDFATAPTLAGPSMANAANDNSNEFQICEYGTLGYLFGMARRKDGDWHCTTRSLDGGATWSDFVDQDGTGGTTALGFASAGDGTGGDCQLGLASTPDGSTIYCSFPVDGIIRARLRIYQSVDGGETFPVSKSIDDHRCAYSDLLCVDNTSLLAAWEMIQDCLQFNSNSLTHCQYIRCARIPAAFFGASGTPRSTILLFNEAANGSVFSTIGWPIVDRGGGNVNAVGYTTNTATATATGVSTVIAGPGLLLARVQEDTAGNDSHFGSELAPVFGDNWTMELAGFDLTGQATPLKMWLSSQDSGRGITGSILSGTSLIRFTINDGTTAVTCTSNAVLPSGKHDLRVEINWDTDVMTLYIDSVAQTLTATLAAYTAASRFGGATQFFIGGRLAGTASCAVLCDGMRFTQGLVTSNYFTEASIATKQTLDTFYGHTVTTPATSPTLVAGAVYLGLATYDGGRGAGKDMWGGWDKGVLPMRRGDGIAAYRDLIGNKHGTFVDSQFRGAWWDTDAAIGPHWRLTRGSSSGYLKMLAAEAGTAFDHIQNTGVFTFSAEVCFVASTGGAQGIFDNHSASANTPGLTVQLDDTTHITVNISDGTGTAVVSKQFTIPAIEYGDWYHIAVTGNGTTLRLYWTAYPGGQASATLAAAQTQAYTSAGWLAGPGGTFPATGIWAFGGRNSDTAGADLRCKNVYFNSTCLGTEALQSDMDFGPAY